MPSIRRRLRLQPPDNGLSLFLKLARFLARFSGIGTPDSAINFSLPTSTRWLPILPETPPPVVDSKLSTSSSSIPFPFASSTIARARGCSLFCYREAAILKNWHSSMFDPGTQLVTLGLPCVNVPVLSVKRRLTFSVRSIASAFLMRIPVCAPFPTQTMIDIGLAKPSAHGQAMCTSPEKTDT